MRSSWKILLAVGAVLLVTPAATLASSGSGGGGGGGGTTTSATVVAGVTVAPTKVAFLSVATGTVRLNKVAASPVTVVVSNDVFNSPNLKFQATTDTASAILTAEFNGQQVPMRNNGGGLWEGQAKVSVAGGDVVVRSNLGGCAAKSPLTPTGSHFC